MHILGEKHCVAKYNQRKWNVSTTNNMILCHKWFLMKTLYHQPLFDNLNYTNIKLILHEENIRNIWRLSISVVIQDCNGQTIIVLYNKLSSSEEMIIVNICIEAVFAIFTRSNCKYDEEKLLSSFYISAFHLTFSMQCYYMHVRYINIVVSPMEVTY